MDDKTIEVKRTPVTIHAFVRQHEHKGYVSDAYGITLTDTSRGNAPSWDVCNIEDDPPYEDCDYGEKSGFLIFEGDVVIRPDAWDTLTGDEQEDIEDEAGVYFGDHDRIYVGSWRRMTASELVAIGLADADPVSAEGAKHG